MTETLIGVITLCVGIFVGWLIRGKSMSGELAAAAKQQVDASSEYEKLRVDHGRVQQELLQETARRSAAEARAERVSQLVEDLSGSERAKSAAKEKVAELETSLADEKRSSEEKLTLLKEAEEKLADAFKALSAEALRSNNEAFLSLAQTRFTQLQQSAEGELEKRQKAVAELVQPIKDSLTKVDGKLGEIEQARVAAYSALDQQLRGLVETHLPMLRNETANLVKALRQPIVRGRWGEIQLRRVVEMAGMLNYCDFVEQESRTTDEGRLRPDVIVRLPGGKQVVVDAKAPLSAYLEAVEATDEEVQRNLMVDHARQVREHMVALGRKAYWDQFQPAPEFVILFLPGEMFFSAALQNDPGLIEFGVNERVIPATPTTLISLLRAVAYGWRQEALSENAQEVAALGKELYQRIAKLAEHWTDVGSKLGRAVDAYNNATGTLETRVLVSARRFEELHAAPPDADLSPIGGIDSRPRILQATEFNDVAKIK